MIAGFPACSGEPYAGHPVVNMRIVELRRVANKPQTERWRCPECGAGYECEIDQHRAIPEGLRAP